ncbi:pilus assembly protein [Brevundimonas sp. S30B]|uniref:ubiquitin-activating E1 FCCH domain-containing protein n=1 Tax=unclassified Brevundimonas TaxID=2622653 RepID=UPI0010718271|nr:MULTISPECIES: ubiquitin-activating E1 FCCH domain-containing protein [unclassified Brevundimonas]QBX38811.1 pilus assembly protein [Brevundimonas sp. MF30-B]TFW00981.1 pilus assembly protein [Brevundimonas sp. S30B]
MGTGRSIVQRARAFAARLAGQTRGNVAMIFALSVPALLLMTMGGVDIHRASTVRMSLQDALDAAALAAARSPYSDAENIQRVGMVALLANMAAYPKVAEPKATFVLNADNIVIADAQVDIDTVVAGLVLPPYGQFFDKTLQVGVKSEVNRSSKDVEVALVLDITGSMDGSRITSLKAAAKDLVETVVQDQQSPYYSRMSIIPYSMGVNMGSYAAGARGALTQSVNISNAVWSSGSGKTISGITQANPGVVTSSKHGFSTGDFVWINNVSGMTQINNRAFRVVKIDNDKFSLEHWSSNRWNTLSTSSNFSKYSSNGTVTKCVQSDCSVVITANNHGLATNDGVYIDNVNGMTGLNNKGFIVTTLTSNTYSINQNGAGWGTYSSGGRSWCGRDGCQWRVFLNMSNAIKVLPSSSCVSERVGTHAYTDASPSTARVGRNYPAAKDYTNSVNPCPEATIRPLSANKNSLTDLIDSMKIGGSTAGQIGAAWGWYTVSPNFNTLWPSNPAGEYKPQNLLKAVILMTDGEFNTPYFEGVIARDAGTGSGANSDHINQNSSNGDPFAQTLRLCNAMKARGVIVYTVGFQVASGGNAAKLMRDCATGPAFAFLPASNADLSDAFRAIGRDITRLRISR